MVRAEGQVEPAGRVKVVNHPDGGRIADIHVAEGDAIAAGEPLVTFDGELVQAELAELTGRWQVKAAEAARLRAEASGEAPVFEPELLQARPALVRQQRELLEMRQAAHASRAETLQQTTERRVSELASLSAELNRFRSSQGLVGKEVTAVRTLAEKGLYPRLRLVALERELSDVVGDTKKAEARLAAAESALAEAESRQRRPGARGALDRAHPSLPRPRPSATAWQRRAAAPRPCCATWWCAPRSTASCRSWP